MQPQSVLVVTLLLCAASSTASVYNDLLNKDLLEHHKYCIPSPREDYVFYFTLRDNEIDISITAPTQGWIAFAVSKPGQPEGEYMIHSDPIIGYVTGGNVVVVKDYTVSGRIGCAEGGGVCQDTEEGGSNDVSDLEGFQTSTITAISFTRPYIATDTAYDNPIGNASQVYLIAYGSDDDVTKGHAADTRFVSTWNLFAPPSLCPGDCSIPRGKCVKGCCQCAAGYTGVDCNDVIEDSEVSSGGAGPGGLSKANIAGIILAVLIVLVVITAFIAWFRKKMAKREKKKGRILLPD